MVLARKKLKLKLHTLLPAGKAAEEEHGEDVEAVKERLASSKRLRPKRERRPKKKLSLPEVVRQTEEEIREEVERRREERRKEKKEKRRIRRLMEAEAAEPETQQVEGEIGEADSAAGSESDQPVEAKDR
jgi:squamous cell carcinoma antigen recognized by T-cells 3